MCNECKNCENFKAKKTNSEGLSDIVENITWQEAMNWARQLGEDWILPNRWQLQILYRAKELGHPDLQDMKGRFWSSSTYVYNTNYVWYVYFSNGDVNSGNKTNSYGARCVRLSYLKSLIIWIIQNDREL